jgi:hypothetical protein
MDGAVRGDAPVQTGQETATMKHYLTPALAMILLTAPATLGQRIENRKDRQEARVEEGKKSGELNKKEAARIKARQRDLNKQIREDRKDGGGLTAVERAKIEKRQDNISGDLYKQKHDAQKAAPKP